MGRENLKRILLIATGGTIASGYTEKGLAPKIAAEDLLQYVEGIRISVRWMPERIFLTVFYLRQSLKHMESILCSGERLSRRIFT